MVWLKQRSVSLENINCEGLFKSVREHLGTRYRTYMRPLLVNQFPDIIMLDAIVLCPINYGLQDSLSMIDFNREGLYTRPP